MAEPTPYVRQGVYNRDGNQCVSCGLRHGLTFQHRQATGMGGSRIYPTCEEGLTACAICNPAFEHVMQTRALLNGWKAPRWVNAHEVPVRYLAAGGRPAGWYRLEDDQRDQISEDEAIAMMHAVYGAEQYEKWRAAA